MSRFIRKRIITDPTIRSSLHLQAPQTPSVHTFQYNEHLIEESDELIPIEDEETVTWIDIVGIADQEYIQDLGRRFNLHPLTVQDIIQPGKRAHHASYDEYMSVRMNMLTAGEDAEEVQSEHLTFVLFERTLITFQEHTGDLFDGVRTKLRENRGKIRRSGADYLLYSLVNAIFTNAVDLIEALGEEIEDNEEILIREQRDDMMHAINRGRSEINFLFSQLRPDRDALRALMSSESSLISTSARLYLRDISDTATQTIEALESYREMVKDQHDALSAQTAAKLNDVMKFLTIFSVIFIPLSLVAGIYGTNFAQIPTINSPFGFYAFLISLSVIALIMILIFKLKKWL